MKRFPWVFSGFLLVLSLAAQPACSDVPPPQAPVFVLPSDGAEPCNLEAERPRLVLLLFWLSSCPYCQAEIPEIHALADSIDPKKAVIYAVHVDGGTTAAVDAVPLMAHANVRICFDDLSVSKLYTKLDGPYRLKGVPHMMWVDSEGVARHPHTGVTKATTLRKDLDQLLSPK